MPKKNHKDLPRYYAVCNHHECQLAESCLHNIAYCELSKTEEYLRLINPTKCSPSADCPYYRDNTPVTYARGFTNFQKKMFPAQYQKFMSICVSEFKRNAYFERRRGDYPMPPHEQEFIKKALKKCGVTEEMEFDRYEQLANWFD